MNVIPLIGPYGMWLKSPSPRNAEFNEQMITRLKHRNIDFWWLPMPTVSEAKINECLRLIDIAAEKGHSIVIRPFSNRMWNSWSGEHIEHLKQYTPLLEQTQYEVQLHLGHEITKYMSVAVRKKVQKAIQNLGPRWAATPIWWYYGGAGAFLRGEHPLDDGIGDAHVVHTAVLLDGDSVRRLPSWRAQLEVDFIARQLLLRASRKHRLAVHVNCVADDPVSDLARIGIAILATGRVDYLMYRGIGPEKVSEVAGLIKRRLD